MAIVWNMLAIKILHIVLWYNDKMGSNYTFILKLVSRSFCIQKCYLRPEIILVPNCLIWTLRKIGNFFPNNAIDCCELLVLVQIKNIVIPQFKLVLMLQANIPSHDMFWRRQWMIWQDYFELCHKSLTSPEESQMEV